MRNHSTVGHFAVARPSLEELMRDESNHRLYNLLQMLASGLERQARITGDFQSRSAIASATAQVVALGTLQRALDRASASKRTEWIHHLRGICTLLDQLTLEPHGHVLIFTTYLTSDEEPVWSHVAHWLVLIVAEFVMNAAKHAFPADSTGEVHVSLTRTKSQITCNVADNGIGLLSQNKAHDSHGMALARRIAEQAGGQCRWTFSLAGTCATVIFPC